MNAAVFAPQLVSRGPLRGQGPLRARRTRARPSWARARGWTAPSRVTKGALGSFDLSRALQSTSAQASGRTPFSELEGSVALANGALALRDLRLASGILHRHGLAGRGPRGRALRAHQRRAAQPARHLLHRRQAAGPAVEEVSAKAPPVPRRPGAAGIPPRQAPSAAAVRPAGHPRPHGRVPPFRRGRGGAGRGGGEAARAAPAVRRAAAGSAARRHPVPRRAARRHHLALVVQGDRHRAQLRPRQGAAHRARHRLLRARWRAQRARWPRCCTTA